MNDTKLIYDNQLENKGRVGFHGNLKKGMALWMRAEGTDHFVKVVVTRAAKFDTITSMGDKQYILVACENDPTKVYRLKRHDRSIHGGNATLSRLAVFVSPSDTRFPVLKCVSFYDRLPAHAAKG